MLLLSPRPTAPSESSHIFDGTWNHEMWNDTDGCSVVLFIDVERPLKWPWSWLNYILLSPAPLVPLLHESRGEQKAWEKKMWVGTK